MDLSASEVDNAEKCNNPKSFSSVKGGKPSY